VQGNVGRVDGNIKEPAPSTMAELHERLSEAAELGSKPIGDGKPDRKIEAEKHIPGGGLQEGMIN
jgi:hypothetical protein